MDKLKFVLEQYRRTFGKKYENYCIERIINLLNNPELIFITQKLFRRASGGNTQTGGIALADLYFPQLNLTVEIDESHHINNAARDKARTQDILDKLSKLQTVVPFEPDEERIIAYNQDLTSLNKRIDEVVSIIKSRISKLQHPLKWQILSTQDIINKKELCINDKVSFATIYEVSKLFNKGYRPGCQRCYFQVASNEYVWCPKLKINGINLNIRYYNEITSDGKIIYESHEDHAENQIFVAAYLNNTKAQKEKRYVFGRNQTESGEYAYIFYGVYQFDQHETSLEQKRVWKRVDIKIDLSHF